jgi:hypothetical protein
VTVLVVTPEAELQFCEVHAQHVSAYNLVGV